MEEASKGTSSVYRKLTSKDKETLALLKSTPVFEIMIKAINLYQKDKAAFSMAMAPDFNNILINRGEIQGSRWIIDLVDYTTTKHEQSLKAKQAILDKENEELTT